MYKQIGYLLKRKFKWTAVILFLFVTGYVYNLIEQKYVDRETWNWLKNNPQELFRITKEKFRGLQILNSPTQMINVANELIGNNITVESKYNCVQLPKLIDIIFANTWQVFNTSVELYLYRAYYDNRPLIKQKPIVRALAMEPVGAKIPKNKTYCQLWFNKGTTLFISEVSHIVHLRYRRKLKALMINCPIPHNVRYLIPIAVSFVEHPCDKATNLLPVVYNAPMGEKKDFAHCLLGVDLPYLDISSKIVEWTELLYILGVEKIFIYELNLHPNISKVFQYYKNLGLVEMTHVTLPGFQANHTYIRGDTLQYDALYMTDCFYMNMYSYNFISIFDADEVIMPLKHGNWKELINYINLIQINNTNNKPTSYYFRMVYFLNSMREKYGWEPGIPKHMYMLQNVYRSERYDTPIKHILNTSRIIRLYDWRPLQCEGVCWEWEVPKNLGHIMHHRNSCKRGHRPSCNVKDVVKDIAIYRYKDELISRTSNILKHLNLLN